MNSQQALAKVVRGVQKFQSEIFPQRRRIFETLRNRQQPTAMFFTCADSRIVTSLVLQTEPGEVFTERTPGNIVPKYGDQIAGVTASVEYAVQVLKVPLVIVCGHSDCGIMKALLDSHKISGLPAVQSWMRHSLEARDRLLRDHANISPEDRLRVLTEINVLLQMENLRTHPAVSGALGRGELELQGWVYDIGSGSVHAADAETGAFKLLANPSGA